MCAQAHQVLLPQKSGTTGRNVVKTASYLLPKGTRGQEHDVEKVDKNSRLRSQRTIS
jgi:hypothetical protein